MKKNLLLLIWGAVLLLAACSEQQAHIFEPVRVTIAMDEYTFTPGQIELKVGQEVTFHLVNNGAVAHELMIGRDVSRLNNRPHGYEQDLFELAREHPVIGGSGEHDHSTMLHSGFMILIPPSTEPASLTFKVTENMAGEWELGCFEQDGVHYDAGMKAILVIQP